MKIGLQTKISDLLKEYPQLEDVLIDISPAFAKLKNPILRRTIAKVTSIQQAAKIGNISASEILEKLRTVVGDNHTEQGVFLENGNDSFDEKRPDWLKTEKIKIRFDATPIIEAGDTPMNEILRLSKQLNQGEILELTTPFRPEPIMDLIRSKGFLVWYDGGKTYFLNKRN